MSVYAITRWLTTSPWLADKLNSRLQNGAEREAKRSQGRQAAGPKAKSAAKGRSEKNDIPAPHGFSFKLYGTF